MTARQVIDKLFGVRTKATENPTATAVQVTATQILQNNPNRLGWTIVNLSPSAMFISFSSEVSATRGIYLAPNGGSASMDVHEDMDAVTWEVWAIATPAAGTCYSWVLEEY